jgi:hypothetical protein
MVDQFMVKKRSVVILMQIVKIFGKLIRVFIYVHQNHYYHHRMNIPINVPNQQKLIILMMNFKRHFLIMLSVFDRLNFCFLSDRDGDDASLCFCFVYSWLYLFFSLT